VRRLYVYYQVAASDLGAVRAAAASLQADLVQAHPGLRAELLRRPELREGRVTLMEVYGQRDGAPPEQAIEVAARQRLARWIVGARHVEVFDALEDAPAATARAPSPGA
jgi:hypothetical protein